MKMLQNETAANATMTNGREAWVNRQSWNGHKINNLKWSGLKSMLLWDLSCDMYN